MKHLNLRMLDNGDALIEGWAIPFTSPFRGNRDLYNTVFDGKTNYYLDWYATRPLTYNHGQDGEMGLEAIGTVRSAQLRDEGVWAEAQINARARYFSQICDMVRRGELQFSSGTIDYLMRVDARSGHVDDWPFAELTLTPVPANPDATVALVEQYSFGDFRAACRSMDIAIADLEGFMAEHTETATIVRAPFRAKLSAEERDALPDSAFAYIDSTGARHLPINDASHVQDALSRVDQTEFESDSAKTKGKKKILAAAKKFGVDVDDEGKRSFPDALLAAYRAAPTPDLIGDLPDWLFAEPPAARASTGSAPVETERSFEDIRADIECALNPTPLGPYDDVGHWSCVIATYDGSVIVARSCNTAGCCDDNPSYWRIGYTLDEQSEPVLDLANQQQMEQVYVPVAAARSADGALALEATALIRHAAALAERTKDLGERRAQEGRPLSATNRRALEQSTAALRGMVEQFGGFLTRDDQVSQEAARVAYWSDPATQQRELDLFELETFALDLT